MKCTFGLLAVSCLFSVGAAQWQGAAMVRKPDTATPYMSRPCITTDRSGHPWVFWRRWHYSGDDGWNETTRWNGAGWDEPTRTADTLRPEGGGVDLAFDPAGTLWVVYSARPIPRGNYTDVYSATFDPTTRVWSTPFQVNAPDTNTLDDFGPRISLAGGEAWATWFNESTQVTSDIKASRWDQGLQRWGSEMTVNPVVGGINRMEWFPDVAVDSGGMPHVIWTCHTPTVVGFVRYSRYEQDHWVEPETLTDPDTFMVYGPYGGTRPRLVADQANNLHAVFLGARPGDSVVGLYYCKRKPGSGWSEPSRTDTWTAAGSPIWCKDIAVDRPDNIWLVFDRGGGSEWRIYAQHFDGVAWSPEERIDDGVTFRGGFPNVALDANGDPFVVWKADTTRTGRGYNIWYNRYVTSGIAEAGESCMSTPQPSPSIVRGALHLPAAAAHGPQTTSLLDVSGRKMMDLRRGPNDVSELAPGVYFLRPAADAARDTSSLTKVIIAR